MSKLADILVKKLAGPAPGSIRELAAELRATAGSGRKAAKLMGVNESTFRRILSGQTKNPKVDTASAMRGAQVRARGLDAAGMNLGFAYDGRTRIVGASNLNLAPGTVEAMGTAYTRGDREGVARAFIDGVRDPWYHDRFDETYEDDLRGEEVEDRDYGADFAA